MTLIGLVDSVPTQQATHHHIHPQSMTERSSLRTTSARSRSMPVIICSSPTAQRSWFTSYQPTRAVSFTSTRSTDLTISTVEPLVENPICCFQELRSSRHIHSRHLLGTSLSNPRLVGMLASYHFPPSPLTNNVAIPTLSGLEASSAAIPAPLRSSCLRQQASRRARRWIGVYLCAVPQRRVSRLKRCHTKC